MTLPQVTEPWPNQGLATPAIEACRLSKSYAGATAVQDLSFRVMKGEVVGFLGPNGAGKSTTLRILSGLLQADRGTARICGLPVSRFPKEIKQRIGFMAENNPLPEDLRVGEYLRLRGHLKGLGGRKLRQRIEECLELCDLHRKARRKLIGRLSKGFRQRVGLAEAILADPAVAFLDEPTIGLDPHQILLTRHLIDTLRGKMTFVISSHILAEVELSADKIIILNQGRIVASGSPEHLREEFIPQRTYKVRFCGSPEALLQAAHRVSPELETTPTDDGRKQPSPEPKEIKLVSQQKEDFSERLLAVLHHTPELRLLGFERCRPTLEEVFLAATRRSWDIEKHPGTPHPQEHPNNMRKPEEVPLSEPSEGSSENPEKLL
jgi:ABC-2 type transport system ATP-binding protein